MKKTAHQNRKWFNFSRWSFSTVISFSVLTLSLIYCAFIVIYCFSLLQENKLQDEVAIQFLETERSANLWLKKASLIKSRGIVETNQKILEYFDKKSELQIYINENEGHLQQYIRDPSENKIYFVSNILSYFHDEFKKRGKRDNIVYILSKEGKLIYTNQNSITSLNFSSRSLVQEFIRNPLTSGMIEFQNQNQDFLGFYKEIYGSNLIFFVETNKEIIFNKINILKKEVIYVSLVALGFMLLLLQIPLGKVRKAILEMMSNVMQLAQGEFKIKAITKSFGEVEVLSKSIVEVGQHLLQRDQRLHQLIQENQEKVRLASELAITSSIQNSFLPKNKALQQSSLSIASWMSPATEAAGDWYQYFSHKETDDTIIAIADVSGHGAGSAMFTAVIGGMFEDFKNQYHRTTDINDFLQRLNKVLFQLGGGKWHATFLVIQHQTSNGKSNFDFFGAGHCFPLIANQDKDTLETHFLRLPGNPLGLSLETEISHKQIDGSEVSKIICYTDGLIEAKNTKGKAFGKRRLRQSVTDDMKNSKQSLLKSLKKSWVNYTDGQMVEDDTCIVIIQSD